MESRIKKLLEDISNNEKYYREVFWGRGIYFIVSNRKILEISDDASSSPKGGWFPEIVSGISESEKDCLESMMKSLGFDKFFFKDFIEYYGDFDEKYLNEFFGEKEESVLSIYKSIANSINTGHTPFSCLKDFADALVRYDLNANSLYYEWEGEFIDLYDNICETGEERGYYEDMSREEWVSILENIDKYILKTS